MHVLCVSHAPVVPTTAGHRQRIRAQLDFMRRRGARISFLYSANEGLTPEIVSEMIAYNDRFYFLPHDYKLQTQSRQAAVERAARLGKPFHLRTVNVKTDDWYDEGLDEVLAAIIDKDPIDVMYVHHIRMSRAFLMAPPGVIKILETHDSFTDRAERMHREGVTSDDFSVTVQEESRALERADIVIAMQEEERAFFQTIASTPAVAIGHIPFTQPTILQTRARGPGQKIRVGLLAHNNPLNGASLMQILATLQKLPQFGYHAELVVAGSLSTLLAKYTVPPYVRPIGMVDKLEDFYADIDLAINPTAGGTGLKIKTAEAFTYGVPMICTEAASRGLFTPYPFHRCKNIPHCVLTITQIVQDPRLLAVVRQAGLFVNQLYSRLAHQQQQLLADPASWLAAYEQALRSARFFKQGPVLLRHLADVPESEITTLRDWCTTLASVAAEQPRLRRGLMLNAGNGLQAIAATQILSIERLVACEYREADQDALRLHVQLDGSDRVAIERIGYALGDQAAHLRLDAPGPDGNDLQPITDPAQIAGDAALAACISVDELFPGEEFDCLFIDGRGRTAAMLAGAGKLLRRHLPLLILRLRPEETAAIAPWLQQFRYGPLRPLGGDVFVCHNPLRQMIAA